VLVSSAVIYIDGNGIAMGRSFPYTANRTIKHKLKTINPICHPSVMMRTEAYRKSIGYLNIQPFEDHVLWLSVARFGKLHNFRYPLLKYRILSESLSRTVSREQQKNLFNYLRKKMSKGHLDEEDIKKYQDFYKSEKSKALLSPQSTDGNEVKVSESLSSPNQEKLYRLCRKLRMPEPQIEQFICTFKNFFLYF